MKKFVLFAIALLSLASAPVLAAEAYIVKPDRSIVLINDQGKTLKVISKPDFAIDVSYGSNEKLWALTTQVNTINKGGNSLAYHNKGRDWILNYGSTHGEEAHALSAHSKFAAAWFVDGEDSKIKRISLDGNISRQNTLPGEGFLHVSAESSERVWAIRQSPASRGNPVMHIEPGAKEWTTVSGINGARISSGWVVTDEGQVVHIDESGASKAFSDKDFARDVSVGPSGRVWITTNEPYPEGGTVIKILTLDRRGTEQWNTVPNIGARRIAAK